MVNAEPRHQATQREVTASLSTGTIGSVDQKTFDYTQKLKAEKAKAGGKSAAFEAAKMELENKSKKWPGGRGDEAGKAFRDEKIKKEIKVKIEAINAVKQGLELANLDPARQATRLDELKKQGLVDTTANATILIHDACSTIANNKLFDVLFPDLTAVAVPDKIVWVQEGLAQNPALREKISTLMGAWQEGVNQFSTGATTQGEQQKIDIATAQLKQKNAYDRMNVVIVNTLKIPKPSIKILQREALDTAMAAGDKPALLNVLAELKGITPTELTVINEYNTNKKLLFDYRHNTIPATAAEIKRVALLVEGNPPTVAAPVIPKMTEYNDVSTTLDSTVFSTNLTTYKEQTDAIDNTLVQKDQEQSSLADLETILDKALLQTYESIEADMVDAKVAVEKQQIAEATKAGRMDEAKMYTNRAKRWIEKQGEGLPEIVHMKNIRTDLNMLREYGKVGVRLLIARDAGLINPNQFDAVVNHTKSAYLTLAQMDEGAITQLDNLANKEGVTDDYFNTIMKDYLRTRKYIKQGAVGRAISYGVGDNRKIRLEDAEDLFGDAKAIRSKFELMDNEMDDLQEKFGTETIDGIIQKDVEAMKFLDKMKKKGVMSEPKLKWLIYMLLLAGMFAVPGLGVAGAAAAGIGGLGVGAEIGGVAAAVGGAAAGLNVGNATKGQLIQ